MVFYPLSRPYSSLHCQANAKLILTTEPAPKGSELSRQKFNATLRLLEITRCRTSGLLSSCCNFPSVLGGLKSIWSDMAQLQNQSVTGQPNAWLLKIPLWLLFYKGVFNSISSRWFAWYEQTNIGRIFSFLNRMFVSEWVSEKDGQLFRENFSSSNFLFLKTLDLVSLTVPSVW